MKINNTILKVIKADITRVKSDAIVNPTNANLDMQEGVALAIREKGGSSIERDTVKKAPILPGEVTATKAGKLSAKYIIHAVTVEDNFNCNETVIRNACKNSLDAAKKLNLKSIAFPNLGCGMGGLEPKAIAKIMAQEVLRHAKYDPYPLKNIIFVLDDENTYEIFNEQINGYIGYIQHKLCQGPFITVDIIIEINGEIVLIERSNPPFGWAIPGGFVDYGESLEDCAKREAKEETNLDVYDLKQMHTYSDPKRDPRFHTITTVFSAKAKGEPKAGDDAQNLKLVKVEEINKLKLAFNHAEVLDDYKKFRSANV